MVVADESVGDYYSLVTLIITNYCCETVYISDWFSMFYWLVSLLCECLLIRLHVAHVTLPFSVYMRGPPALITREDSSLTPCRCWWWSFHVAPLYQCRKVARPEPLRTGSTTTQYSTDHGTAWPPVYGSRSRSKPACLPIHQHTLTSMWMTRCHFSSSSIQHHNST